MVEAVGGAAAFSARTAWHFGYGPKHARGYFWTAVTLTQMIGFKAMAILLLQAIANTSPLLNQLVARFIPV